MSLQNPERILSPDTILQEALKAQNAANQEFIRAVPTARTASSSTNMSNDGLTLTVLGCGTMGIAILGGILDSLSTKQPESSSSSDSTPKRLPTKFNTCVRRQESAKRIKNELGGYEAFKNVTSYENNNIGPVKEADIVLLGCKPYMVNDILKTNEMRAAMSGKLLISICAGVTEEQLTMALTEGENPAKDVTVIRAMPNTAAAVRESMTVIGTSNPPLPDETSNLITWIFERIGKVVRLPAANMDASTALCGSGPAFVALMAESMAAGAIAMGLPRDEAYLMAAQTMRGTTGLLLAGEHPAILRDKVTTPGGCTIGGLLVLEEGMVRGTVAKAVREATVVASQLGQGKSGVNGTRH
ncbi:pyrroline-5-carboxylate reductase [Acrodontium crateriforme]|uniref:Pyrroline-5-carboxylate reductase n=1 Tax=Acrodontium crateriforme TaxID=150365 RepID=A0AAQ3MAB7_9PEZI|nr:pyrroline-5-carboxylate reductase [Acrodontium crateriforme]